MKISIALATYNGAMYLKDQLDSYVAQERLPDELVVCDDVSTDDTVDILEAFKKSAPFQVRIIKNPSNLGFTRNFEKVLSQCVGDLILLSDQDDVWFPEKTRIVEEFFTENTDKYLVIHDGELVDDGLVSSGVTKRGQVMAGYGADDRFITGALTSVRKEFIRYALPIPDGIIMHDKWLHNLAGLMGKRSILCQSLQLLRRHSTNTSAWLASSLKSINRVTVARSQFSRSPASSYDGRLLYNASLIERLHAIEQKDHSDIPSSTISTALAQLRTKRNALICRNELIRLGFINRKLYAVKMLASGDYAYFNGLRSFVRDFFR